MVGPFIFFTPPLGLELSLLSRPEFDALRLETFKIDFFCASYSTSVPRTCDVVCFFVKLLIL